MSKYTAIVRKAPSVPMRWLDKQKLLKGRVLDYGCGRGFDVSYYQIEGYDPNWNVPKPEGKFDTIVCNFVLNVVTPKVEKEILKDVKALLNSGGKAYFTVRRDFKRNYKGRGCIQRLVYLDLESIRKTSKQETYVMCP